MKKEKSPEKSIEAKINDYLEKHGLKMYKKISSGGLLTSPTYDSRTVFTRKDLSALNKEGFRVDEDMGIWLFNALLT